MCLSSGLIMFNRFGHKNFYLFFLKKTLANLDQMEVCFSCKTTAIKTTDNFCPNCGSKKTALLGRLHYLLLPPGLFICRNSNFFGSIPQPKNLTENSEKRIT